MIGERQHRPTIKHYPWDEAARLFLPSAALRIFTPRLIVVSRRVFQFVALRFLMIDPQLRMIKGNQIGHALHRQLRLNSLLGRHGAEIGDAAGVPIFLQVNGVAAQQESSLFLLDERGRTDVRACGPECRRS